MWTNAIKKAMMGPGRVWIEDKRFDSFAPQREHCTATWYVKIINATEIAT